MLSPRRSTRIPLRFALILGLLCGMLPGLQGAAAQTFPSSVTGASPTLPQAARLNRSSVSSTQSMALEGAVNPQEYLVGPGDVFAIVTGGAIPQQTESMVSADGRLVVPEAGAFRVAGRSLAAVIDDVGAALQRRYRNVTTGVSLLEPRKFSVHVSGSVPAPGRYAVRAVARVEDALTEAMAETGTARGLATYDHPIERERERRPALRNVLITRKDGTTDRVDLMRYFATGDIDSNPYLRDGDAIHLPTFDPIREGVFVYGAVDRPAVYDFRPGDTAEDVIGVASGRDLSGRIGTVRVTRGTPGAAPSIMEVPLAEAATLLLEPRDQVFAIASDPGAGIATVVGAVRFPGGYPIRAGETTLTELVTASGGLRDDALLRGAYIERSERSEPDEAIDPLVFSDNAERLTIGRLDSTLTGLGRQSDLTLIGRRYFVEEYLATPRLSIDIEAALNGTDLVRLQDGDRLVVPVDLGVTRVYGQVRQPGYLPFEPNRTAQAWVDAAGGTAPAATDIYVVDAATGQFFKGTDTPVRAGDAVFVARIPTAVSTQLESIAIQERREERDIERDQRQARFQTIQSLLVALSIAVSTVLTIVFR